VTLADTVRRHRQTPAELRAELRTMDHRLKAADDYFKRLTADRNTVYAAYEDMKTRAIVAEDEATETRAERDDLADQVEQQYAELVELRARVAGLDPFQRLAIGTRDIDDGDAPTEPIDVRAWRTRYAVPAADAIAVMPLRFAPFATAGQAETPPPAARPSLLLRFDAGEQTVTVSGGHRRTA
jgi:hypothetical protein